MVLLSPAYQTEMSQVLTGDGYVWMFFIFFKTVVLRDNAEDEKSIEQLSHLETRPFEFLSRRFTMDGVILEDDENLDIGKNVFFEEFESKDVPEEIMRSAMDEKSDT